MMEDRHLRRNDRNERLGASLLGLCYSLSCATKAAHLTSCVEMRSCHLPFLLALYLLSKNYKQQKSTATRS